MRAAVATARAVGLYPSAMELYFFFVSDLWAQPFCATDVWAEVFIVLNCVRMTLLPFHEQNKKRNGSVLFAKQETKSFYSKNLK